MKGCEIHGNNVRLDEKGEEFNGELFKMQDESDS